MVRRKSPKLFRNRFKTNLFCKQNYMYTYDFFSISNRLHRFRVSRTGFNLVSHSVWPIRSETRCVLKRRTRQTVYGFGRINCCRKNRKIFAFAFERSRYFSFLKHLHLFDRQRVTLIIIIYKYRPIYM